MESAANTYSSGLMECFLFPISSWVWYARNCKTQSVTKKTEHYINKYNEGCCKIKRRLLHFFETLKWNTYQSENYRSYSCIKHVKPKYLQQQIVIKITRKPKKVSGNSVTVFTTAVTHVFEGQHNGCNDASHEHDNAEDAEKTLALGEVDLQREIGSSHLNLCPWANTLWIFKADKQKCARPYLRLEAEHCDGDADDSCDSQRKKHCFCVIVTKTKEQHTVSSEEIMWMFLSYKGTVYIYFLPGYGSSHIRQRQSLFHKKIKIR